MWCGVVWCGVVWCGVVSGVGVVLGGVVHALLSVVVCVHRCLSVLPFCTRWYLLGLWGFAFADAALSGGRSPVRSTITLSHDASRICCTHRPSSNATER